MFFFLITLFAVITVHLVAIASVGKAIGVSIRKFSLGFGPTIFQFGIFRIGAIPTGGYVRFRDSQEEPVPPEEMKSSLSGRSSVEQIVISLSGCVVLLSIGITLAGTSGFQAFMDLPLQVFVGASSPLDKAQTLLKNSSSFVQSAPIGILTGILCAKYAALNCIPFPATNGAVTIAILGRRFNAEKWWPSIGTPILTIVTLVIFASWSFALLIYAISNV
ncbi:site-2 protease family protein [Collimonas sp. NPDC087041]|uniref:site-2 protease family protein n=1 Tax=Collimonas sp. NPDC087041 TaxID=3363960 RepID=UPI00380E2E34